MSRRFCFIVTLLALWISGCAPTREAMKERNLPMEEVIARVKLRNEMIKTLRGDGMITVESPEASNSGSFDAYLKKPDSLLVELRGPFGIHVGTLSLTREKFLFYNIHENTALVGKPDGVTLRSMFRLNMDLDEVLRAFTGEFSIDNVRDSLVRFYAEGDLYIIAYRVDGITKEYRIDGENFVVSSYREIDVGSNVIFTALTSRVVESEDIAMPTVLRIIFPKERRSVSIAYDDVHVNEPVECSFTIPKGVALIHR